MPSQRTKFALTTLAAIAAATVSAALWPTASWSEDAAAPAATPHASQIAAARNAIKLLSDGLQGELKTAMAAGGPVAALSVCNVVAPVIAANTQAATLIKVKRTSHKVRNPDNAPDELEGKVLADFLAKTEAGADLKTLEHSEVATTESGKRVLRYFKAIPMQAEPCLACHGSAISDEVKTAIGTLYPDDQAVGFKAGDLRGMFSAAVPLGAE